MDLHKCKKNKYFNRKRLTNYLEKWNRDNDNLWKYSKQPVLRMFNFRKDKQLKHSTYVMNNSFSIGCHQSICNNAKNYVIYKFKKFFEQI